MYTLHANSRCTDSIGGSLGRARAWCSTAVRRCGGTSTRASQSGAAASTSRLVPRRDFCARLRYFTPRP